LGLLAILFFNPEVFCDDDDASLPSLQPKSFLQQHRRHH
jgi:hypothetical protein